MPQCTLSVKASEACGFSI